MNISYYDFKNLPNESQCDIIFNEGHLMSETVKMSLDLFYTRFHNFL